VKRIWKILLWTLVVFFIYAVITSPSQAANIVQNAWDIILQGFQNIGAFFNELLKRN
jgi:hypothetical protein